MLATLAQVGPLYALRKSRLQARDQRGITFATTRLAAGAAATRT